MVRKILLITKICLCYQVISQEIKYDSLYLYKGNLAVKIKEVSTNTVKYTLPNEEILYTIDKNEVSKIKFSSGRVEFFSNNLKMITGGKDWQNVKIYDLESELLGLFKITQFNSTVNKVQIAFFENNNVQDIARVILKKQTAMLGGNAAYLKNLNTDNVNYGGLNTFTDINIQSVIFSSTPPKLSNLMSVIGEKRQFELIEEIELRTNEVEIRDKVFNNQSVVLENIFDENGKIIVLTKIPKLAKSERHRVIYFDEQNITLVWRNKDRIINYKLKIPQN